MHLIHIYGHDFEKSSHVPLFLSSFSLSFCSYWCLMGVRGAVLFFFSIPISIRFSLSFSDVYSKHTQREREMEAGAVASSLQGVSPVGIVREWRNERKKR